MLGSVLKSCLLVFGTLLLATGLFAQTPSFSHLTYPGLVGAKADFNQDGREDFLERSGNNQITIIESTGDGIYAAGATYTLPSSVFIDSFAIGDFNGDGKADFVVATSQTTLYEFAGNGDGTFTQHTFTLPSPATSIVAADFNHDGKMDIAYLATGGQIPPIQVMFGNNNGTFTTGPLTSTPGGGELQVGDFDGEGNADIVVQNCEDGCLVEVFYGDGTGHFPTQVNVSAVSPSHGAYNLVVDLDGDGKSDLVGAVGCATASCTYINTIYVYYGNSSRTWTETAINTTKFDLPGGYDVADVNGDGIPDLVFTQSDDRNQNGTTFVSVLTGKGSRTFNPEQTIYSSADNLQKAQVVRADRNTKPDVVVNDATSPSSFAVLQNQTSASKFPTCTAPDAYEGINVCSPSSSASSPVSFRVGAAGETPMHRVEVWVDGAKKLESLYGDSHYTFLDGSLSLASGSHQVTVYAAGWDNWLEKKSFTLNVGAGSCSAPSSAGVHICSPVNSSAVSSPVHAQATGKVTGTFARMELWVDGTKRFTTSSSILDTHVSLAVGAHRFTFFAINAAGQKWSATVNATVH